MPSPVSTAALAKIALAGDAAVPPAIAHRVAAGRADHGGHGGHGLSYRGCLARLEDGRPARIVRVMDEEDVVAWLEAMGIGAGETVVVLRRASFGGPLHVRTGVGGEFAVDRSLASRIHVESEGRP